MPPPSGTHVRPAKPSEIPQLAAVFTRAFLNDPSRNWFGSVRTDSDPKPHGLGLFELTLVKIAAVTGLVIVAVVPDGDGKERVVGGACWQMPGLTTDASFLTIFRSSPWKSAWTWGVAGLKIRHRHSRTVFGQGPAVEKAANEMFAARGLKRTDAWHLFEIGVDPEYTGQGIATLLMRDGFERAAPKPIHLDSTTPKSRDIYAHFGFEVGKELKFGVGKVNSQGILAKGEDATGWSNLVMAKWQT